MLIESIDDGGSSSKRLDSDGTSSDIFGAASWQSSFVVRLRVFVVNDCFIMTCSQRNKLIGFNR